MMLQIPIALQVVPIALAGMIALTPVNPDRIAQLKDSAEKWIDKNITTNIGNKSGEKVTKITTIREGFKGELVDGKIYEIPYKQITTVEKTYQEISKEEGKQEQDTQGEKQQQVTEDPQEEPKTFSITRTIYNGGKTIIKKVWKWI